MERTFKKIDIKNLCITGLFVAIGVALPRVFHVFSLGGSAFLPMHIPVLLCGLLCGAYFGGICGILVPLLSSVITGMPPLFPIATSMMFELATYGIVCGLLRKRLNVFLALIIAMLCGRAVYGIFQVIFLGISGKSYAFSAFFTSVFVVAIPGIIIQLILIPIIVMALKRAKVIDLK